VRGVATTKNPSTFQQPVALCSLMQLDSIFIWSGEVSLHDRWCKN
jgi:hypothetical protein